MVQKLTGRKTLAMFILAFLCLNVGGALCLTYCSQAAMAASAKSDDPYLSDHCRKAKKEAEDRNKDASKVEAGEASCCMMPVVLFAAPVEKRTSVNTVLTAENVAAVEFDHSSPEIVSVDTVTVPVYRPPPLDRRVERLLNCVIRI